MKLDRVIVYTVTDEDPDLSWLDQSDAEMGPGFEAWATERKAAFRRGDWEYTGVVVDAMISWEDAWDGNRCVVPGGSATFTESLWGVESDSERSYVESVARDLIEELREQLRARFGKNTPLADFSDDAITWEL